MTAKADFTFGAFWHGTAFANSTAATRLLVVPRHTWDT
jgi:hypothetical protein